MRSHRAAHQKNLATVIALAGIACAFTMVERGEGASDAPTSQPAPDAAPVMGPIAYYVANCARCHGDVSAAYTGLAHPKRGDALKQEIDDMANGPGQAPLDPEGLKQQTALHEAMFGKTPFVWVDPGQKNRIAGEVLPETTITFEPAAGPAVTPKIADNHFDLPRQPGTLVAKRGDAVVKIPIP